MKLHHPKCDNPRCEICLEDHEALQAQLSKMCGTGFEVIHLDLIKKWMNDNGKDPETEWGWFTPEVFEEKNINEYVEWYNAK